jgi:hypothetical protein
MTEHITATEHPADELADAELDAAGGRRLPGIYRAKTEPDVVALPVTDADWNYKR